MFPTPDDGRWLGAANHKPSNSSRKNVKGFRAPRAREKQVLPLKKTTMGPVLEQASLVLGSEVPSAPQADEGLGFLIRLVFNGPVRPG